MNTIKYKIVVDESLEKQVLMFYHLKTRCCVNTVHMVSKLKHIADMLFSLFPFYKMLQLYMPSN